MKKNRMMRLASLLLVLVLMTSSVVGGTFAKYVTKVESQDSARVAKWGFNTASITIANLFADSYTNVAAGTADQAIIAPGTDGRASFKFENAIEGAPEVAYTFTVSTEGSSCNDKIQANNNIKWALVEGNTKGAIDGAQYGTWSDMITKLQALDGSESYKAGEIPEMVDKDYTILWKWTYDNADDGNAVATNDSYLGNLAVTENLVATLKITITATQVK